MMLSDIPSADFFREDIILKPASCPTRYNVPDVTVVTVCYNPLKDGRKDAFIKNLDSVQNQTGVLLEHLIIDGASTDGTIDFLKAYSNTQYDIRIMSKTDTGIYEAMNRGIALSQGKYVIFLNTDDYYHCPDGIARSVKVLEDNDCSFTFSPINPIGPHTQHSPHRNPQRRLHKFFLFCTLPHPSMLFRRTALVETDGYDETYRLAADYDMMLRMVSEGHKACFVNCCFATFLASGFSQQNRELNVMEKTRIVRNFHNKVFGTELTDTEAAYLVSKCKYPRKYLSVYVKSQKLISDTFMALPQGFFDKLSRRFNYMKYYIKSFLSF